MLKHIESKSRAMLTSAVHVITVGEMNQLKLLPQFTKPYCMNKHTVYIITEDNSHMYESDNFSTWHTQRFYLKHVQRKKLVFLICTKKFYRGLNSFCHPNNMFTLTGVILQSLLPVPYLHVLYIWSFALYMMFKINIVTKGSMYKAVALAVSIFYIFYFFVFCCLNIFSQCCI